MKTKKKLIISSFFIAFVVLGLVFWNFLVKKENSEFNLEKVKRGTVLQTVSETGTIKASEEVDLAFEETGRIERIYVEVGEEVARNDELAKLDTSELLIQLREAQAALEVVRAKKIDTQVSLENARQNLNDVKADADEDLKNAYEDAVNTLNDAYFKIYKTYSVVCEIQQDYFTPSNEKAMRVIEEKYKIKGALEKTKTYIGNLENNPQNEDIDLSLSNVKELLKKINDSLEVIQEITKTEVYHDVVSDSDKASLDTQKSNINSAYTNIVNSQQVISTVKIKNEANINTAKAKVIALETQLQENGEISSLYQAQINQAQAKVSLLQNQIQKATLKSPDKGQITKINKREGEMVSQAESVISFLPSVPFQIEADIYEEDIVKVKVGDPVTINIVAFPNESLKGKVCAIDPVEKVIDGVVYYKVTIDFGKEKKGLKPGMTADIVIETDKRENVLIIPKEAIKKRNGKNTVWVFENGEVKEKEIEIGLVGDDFAEIVSGLKEGEEIIIR